MHPLPHLHLLMERLCCGNGLSRGDQQSGELELDYLDVQEKLHLHWRMPELGVDPQQTVSRISFCHLRKEDSDVLKFCKHDQGPPVVYLQVLREDYTKVKVRVTQLKIFIQTNNANGKCRLLSLNKPFHNTED